MANKILNWLLNKSVRFLPDYFLYDYNHKKEIYQMLQKADIFCRSNYVEGDYLEFGVGESFIMADKIMERHLWGFDSFEGLPKPVGVDTYKGKWKQGQFKVKPADFEGTNRTLIQGYYDDTLKKPLDIKPAVVHIDCDLYHSCKLVLEFLATKLQPGTVVLFDDYYCFDGDPNKGEALALKEFLILNPDLNFIPYQKYHFAGNSFIVGINPLQ